MHQSSLQYLRCIKCNNDLKLEAFEHDDEILEGMLTCTRCGNMYPIISSIPFLVDDLSLYFSIRAKLGGYLLLHTKNLQIKSIIKQALQKISHVGNDTTDLEKNWSITYKQSKKSQFHLALQNAITRLPKCNLVIEHGCSIGTTTMALAKKSNTVFGIDKSFFALLEAKKRKIKDADFFLADSLSRPFRENKI
ncbi:MAG: hypothetical protein KGH76_01135 [Thaumarchaeota archaeon]|nr:hypothetical protein [Nitrososphaerota archaeon]